MAGPLTKEQERLDSTTSRASDWKKWGPYVSERAWGTVREDYSPHGTAWEYFPHDHARSRVYRWSEDGIGGICDREQRLCFGIGLWNGKDAILKERLFGVTGNDGNHGEDVKEYYYYLDSTPTHSYMKMLYKYPQAEYPYGRIDQETKARGRKDPEFELIDSGVFNENRYWDVFVEYAKAGADDILARITVHNRGPEAAELAFLGQIWFRNTWNWGNKDSSKPELYGENGCILLDHHTLGSYRMYAEGKPTLLFTENETNKQRLWNIGNDSPFVKDAFHEYVIHGNKNAVNTTRRGTKAAALYKVKLDGGAKAVFRMRLSSGVPTKPFEEFDAIFAERIREADEFYAKSQPATLKEDEKLVQRQAYAGLLWTKQYFGFDVDRWLHGDPGNPPPPKERIKGRNAEWGHLNCADVISMPDKWEYPWFAAWDLAFHCIPLAQIDPAFAKRQLILMLREWYMHPNGQIPAYEWAFGDVNPPVHAWASWRVYKIDKKMNGGQGDTQFLERVFHKLMLNFTWWVNRKDAKGNNVFQGGFLGMDNIGVFDRSQPLPTGGHLEQSDGTSWMGMYCLNMMSIALELAKYDLAYEDVATKFFEHFMFIAYAMNHAGGEDIELWSEKDKFFYDVLQMPGQKPFKLRVRSMVGLIPLLAVETIETSLFEILPRFKRRMDWFLENRPEMAKLVSRWEEPGSGERRLLALLRGHRMKRVLQRVLDPNEFLSDFGIRALSKYHEKNPYVFTVAGHEYRVDYEPAESRTGLFGGNSNWRGPIWMPVNFLIIEALQKFHHYYSDDFRVECPAGTGKMLSLREIADEISRRLCAIFVRDTAGNRPVNGTNEYFQKDPNWKDLVPFYEYFHGDSGAGLGASHQTGWTALVAKLLQSAGEARLPGRRSGASSTMILTARPDTIMLAKNKARGRGESGG